MERETVVARQTNYGGKKVTTTEEKHNKTTAKDSTYIPCSAVDPPNIWNLAVVDRLWSP